MTITLDLKPELEQRLRAAASAVGVPVETYTLGLIELGTPGEWTPQQKTARLNELYKRLDNDPAAHSAPIPLEALSRTAIYTEDGDSDLGR